MNRRIVVGICVYRIMMLMLDVTLFKYTLDTNETSNYR